MSNKLNSTEKHITTPEIRAFEKKTELPLLTLALIMLVTLVVPHYYPIPPEYNLPLEILDIFIWLAFALEFGYRIYLSPRKVPYVIRNWLDVLIVVLPMLRVARLIRALRLLRIFSVFYRRFKSLQSITRRSRFDLLVVVMALLMRPFALGTLVILVSLLAKDHIPDPFIQNISTQAIIITLIISAGYIIHRIFIREILVFAIRQAAKKSDASYDSIVVPIIEKLSPIIAGIITILFLLQTLGFNITALSVMIGGVSFILAFALQETLSSIFAGIFMGIDSPYRQGDIINISDLGNCEVKKIGIRATELYVIDTNTSIFIPNNIIASEKIINISRPQPDIISQITFNVAYKTDLSKCTDTIKYILDANPYIIGNPKAKITAMKKRVSDLKKNKPWYEDEPAKLSWGIKYWTAKESFNPTYNHLVLQLQSLAQEIGELKKSGLSDAEKETIRKSVASLESLEEKLKKEYLEVYSTTQADPKLLNPHTSSIEIYNLEKLSRRYFERYTIFERRITELFKTLKEAKEHHELLLDDFITSFVDWMDSEFQTLSNTFEYPSVKVTNLGDSTLGVTCKFYITGIDLEKYRRIGRVESEVKMAVLAKFERLNIEMPFPTQEIILKK